MFLDEIVVKVIAGNGGDGCTSFRREKYVAMGGPDGGNGGRGSDVIFKAEKGLKTLIDLRFQKTIKGSKGENGKGSNRQGSNAQDIIIKVPIGTTLIDHDTNLILADLIEDEQSYIVAAGGRGGRGNKSFATHGNKAPKMSENGEPGEIRLLKCELKVLADVGLVGFPSVGKSTLLSVVSSAKPKIAEYHFTTLSPNLGMIKLKDGRNFIMADLPGLIEGAAEGRGLGDLFLRHTARTRLIIHVIDMSNSEGRDPIIDYRIINKELEKYGHNLIAKKQIVVANKMDLPKAKENLERFKKSYPDIKIFPISAVYNEGIEKLLKVCADLLDIMDSEEIYNEDEYEGPVLFKFKEEKPYTITKEDDLWIIKGEEIEKLFKMTKLDNEDAVLRFARKLRGMGVEDELEVLGANRGDEVSICNHIFQFKE